MVKLKKYCLMLVSIISVTVMLNGCSNVKQIQVTSDEFTNLNIDKFGTQYDKNLNKMDYYKYKNITIGFVMDSLKEERWKKDKEFFLNKAKELNVSVRVTEANGDANLQITQAENLIAEGVNVLVVVPVNGDVASTIIEKAHKANIKVLSYDRLIKNSDVDYYISYDNEKVGKLQGEEMIKAVPNGNLAYVGGSPTDNNALLFRKGTMDMISNKINNNSVHLVMDKYSTDWNPNEAYKNVKQLLETNDSNISGIICANDGTASGAIQALKEKGLDGKIPVTGQDADLGACQNIVNGKQLMTVYKPVKPIAEKSVELAINIANNKPIETNNKVNNNFKDVNSLLLDPVVVTKDNMKDTIIKDNWISEKDIYKNVK